MKNHFLIYGHGGCYNHGAEAITKTTIEFLRKISPGCKITLSSYFPEQDKEFGICADEYAERNPNGKTNSEVYASTMEAIKSETIGIHVGGDNYCYKNWQRYAEIHYALKKNGKKSILWGCSIDENMVDDEMLSVLKTHDLILAREEKTYEMLVRKGLTNVKRVCDIAFTMKPQETSLPDKDYVCINISPLVCKKNENALPAITDLISYLSEETNETVVLVPHVTMPMDNDYDLQKKIIDSLENKNNRVLLCSDKLSAAEIKYIISGARICISARTHAIIAAYSTCVPSIAIGYSVKAKGIAEDMGMEEFVVDIEQINSEDLIEMTKKCLCDIDEIREKLKRKLPLCLERAMNNEIISEILK